MDPRVGTGKVALVVGATQGMGRAIARSTMTYGCQESN